MAALPIIEQVLQLRKVVNVGNLTHREIVQYSKTFDTS